MAKHSSCDEWRAMILLAPLATIVQPHKPACIVSHGHAAVSWLRPTLSACHGQRDSLEGSGRAKQLLLKPQQAKALR